MPLLITGAVVEYGMEPMLVLEYMELGSFYDVLHNETMFIESSVMLHILQDVSQGMRFLHASIPQVIHGDLKAVSIFCGRVSIAEFARSLTTTCILRPTYWLIADSEQKFPILAFRKI